MWRLDTIQNEIEKKKAHNLPDCYKIYSDPSATLVIGKQKKIRVVVKADVNLKHFGD